MPRASHLTSSTFASTARGRSVRDTPVSGRAVEDSTAGQVTRWLARFKAGESAALGSVFDVVYEELRVLAHRQVARFHPDQTLNATSLVHELFVRLDSREPVALANRRHLLAVAATAMRQIAVDYARGRRRAKRGGVDAPIPLDAVEGILGTEACEAEAVLSIDQALRGLESVDARLGKVVEMRFFGGFSVEETADALSVSTPTVKRDTRIARAFLTRELGRSP